MTRFTIPLRRRGLYASGRAAARFGRAPSLSAAAGGPDNRYSSNVQSLAEIFSPHGALEAHLPEFAYRESQHRMAEIIWESFETHRHAALEAGTGIGKTFAYLIPVLLSGRRAIVSTGTKTLQDQLFSKDLPALGAAIGRAATVAVLKGRANYLCWHRLELARADFAQPTERRHMLDALAQWGQTSGSGDLTELEDFEADYGLRADVTSTVDNCLGSQCPQFERCFVAEARRRAQAAQIVIVNHHLLLADLALKEAGFGELLGDAESVIVDEAHLLPDIAQQFFGESATTREIERLAADVFGELGAVKPAESVYAALNELSRCTASLTRDARRPEGRLPWQAVDAALRESLHAVGAGLANLASTLADIEQAPAGVLRCAERCVELGRRFERILDFDDEEGMRWLEIRPRSLGLHWTPLDVGQPLGARIADQGGNWIFASATLAVADSFEHFLSRVGLGDVLTGILPSPFNYRENARYYLPEGLPEPRDPDHATRLMEHVWPLIQAAGGGAFVLFTSYKAMHSAEQWLRYRDAPGEILIQGSGPRSQLLEQFRATQSAVLLGTGSFWQGVDVRGTALRIVVIDKLPFAAPNDPLVAARSRAIRRDGGDPFFEFQLPQAVLALKQGVGRLIRDYDDRGLIVLGDPRLRTRGYGRVFLASLPDAPHLGSLAEAIAYAASLNPTTESSNESIGH